MSARARVLFLKGRAKSYGPLVDYLTDIADTTCVATLAAFKKSLGTKAHEAALCTASFHGGIYGDVLALVQELRSDIPVIVCTEEDGDPEWVEALESGAFDLLVAPFERHAVAKVIEEALESRDAGRTASLDTRRLALRRRRFA